VPDEAAARELGSGAHGPCGWPARRGCRWGFAVSSPIAPRCTCHWSSSPPASRPTPPYRQETAYWSSGLPDTEDLTLTVAWPEIGLPATAATLQLPGPTALARAAVVLC
jgi:hypothetical protein